MSMNEVECFSGRLETIVSKIGHRAFARMCGLSETALRKYINGESTPNIERLISISKAAGVSIDWLVTGSEPLHSDERESNLHENAPVQIPEISILKVIDKDVMVMAIEVLEQGLVGSNLFMNPAQKAEFIASYYMLLAGAKDEAARNSIRNQINDIMRTTLAVMKS